MNQELQPFVPERDAQNAILLPAPPPDRFSTAAMMRAQMHRWLTALRRRWWVLLLSFLFIGGPAIYYTAITPPTFRSQAIMWLTGRLNLRGEGFYTEELTSYIATQAELIKSPTIQSRAFEKVCARFPGIAGAKTNAASPLSIYDRIVKFLYGVKEAETNTVSPRLPFDLSVRSSQKNSVLALAATGPSPEATRAFLDAIMAEYLALKKDSRTRNSSGALSSITDQIDEVEKQIKQQQGLLIGFGMSNNISYLTEHGLSAGSHLARLVEALSDLRTEYRLLELLTPEQFKDLAKGSQYSLSDSTLPGEKTSRALAVNANWAADTTFYQALQGIEVLKAKRDEFAQVLRPTHSKMVKLNQEISGLDQLLKTLKDEGGQQVLAQMANRRKLLELQIQNLETQYHDWETNASEASVKLAAYDRMKQDLQRSQALYDRLLGLLQTVDLNNNLEQEPLVPLAPAPPARPTLARIGIAAAGLFLALLVGVGVFLFLEFLDDRFSSVTELSLHLQADVVGQIPKIRLSPHKGIRHLLPAAGTQPAFAESFRNLRSSLLFMSGEDPQPKVILVTSAIPKEGKTTVASNLARTLAVSGSRVLLVDADVRRGSLHRIFGVGLKPGLVEVLSQGVSPALVVVPTAEPNLFLLPAGEAHNSSSDVLLRCRVDLLLHDLARQYNYIVIDSPPVLATDDAPCLGSYTDGAFMVVRASFTSSRMVVEALDRLRRRNVKVLGMLYNFAPRSTDYYWRYNRDYHSANGAADLSALGTAATAAGEGPPADKS